MRDEISVVMAARDAAATLPGALESILHQSLPPAEVLIVLNGCQDDTPKIAHAFAAEYSVIRVLESSPSGGVAEAAELGCRLASSPLLARMDCDDLAHPNRLAEQRMVLQERQADLVTCRISPLESLGSGIDRYIEWANTLRQPSDFTAARFIESPVIQPGVLMTQEAYRKAGGYRRSDGPEDYDLWLRMLADGARFFQAPRAELEWRDSATRLTRTHDDYCPELMTRTKAHHLAQVPEIAEYGVTIAGSGPQGRRMTRLLLERGVQVHKLYDVDPRKIGSQAHGRPIVAAHEMSERDPKAVLLACVGRGGREKIRKLALACGYSEGVDYFACC